ncbi:MaoC family dehydratase [Streptomyces endophyticus]|uniref:MaoC family dehydratase n=1 Tax=Streptomyces endophyticus TaxID=714166 RepID=A0ABU6EXM4_9ACTN|nr:MaoC family dehydratase [Streptomyces endophyticus]MEB8336516.1 MaoC family dehydratase [Streptomyces endophyticus]
MTQIRTDTVMHTEPHTLPTEPRTESRTEPSTEITQRGLYFEELEPGVRYAHRPGRTLGEADNTFFTTLTMNPQSLHLDEHAAADTEFGQRLVNSLLTLSTVVGLSVGQLTQGTTVANLGFEQVTFPAPVFHGDTLYAETEVIAKRASASRPDDGVVTFEHRGRNQRGELVAVVRRVALMRRDPANSAAEDGR